MIEPAQDPDTKAEWRVRLTAARRALSPELRAREASALVSRVVELAGDPVCCYLPVGSEPGSIAMVDALAADRCVLLPVVTGAAPLDWARYRDPADLAPGPHGLRQPVGPRLGPDAIGTAALVFVPALAVDRRGVRLGRGGGHYDRSLPLARPDVALIAIVRDAELLDRLPDEPHDIRMTGALTPGQGVHRFTEAG